MFFFMPGARAKKIFLVRVVSSFDVSIENVDFPSERDSMPNVLPRQSQNRSMILVLLSLAMFMVILDSAIVNVALPAMKAALHFDTSSLQWVLTAYILTFGGFLMLGGRTADLFGRRFLLVLGIGGFSLFSLLLGLTSSSVVLIA